MTEIVLILQMSINLEEAQKHGATKEEVLRTLKAVGTELELDAQEDDPELAQAIKTTWEVKEIP